MKKKEALLTDEQVAKKVHKIYTKFCNDLYNVSRDFEQYELLQIGLFASTIDNLYCNLKNKNIEGNFKDYFSFVTGTLLSLLTEEDLI